MLTFFFILVFMPVFITLMITMQRWLLQDAAEKPDFKWELYQQHHD